MSWVRTARPLRDRLGEALRLALHAPGPAPVPWFADREGGEEVREHWRDEADRLLSFAPACGIAISIQEPAHDHG